MNERIRITQLRADAANVIDSGGITHGLVLVHPDDLSALLDAVEALRELEEAADAIHVYPEGATGFDDLAGALTKAQAALTRFELEEPA